MLTTAHLSQSIGAISLLCFVFPLSLSWSQDNVAAVKSAVEFQLTPDSTKPFLYLESNRHPEQRWRLWIPEVFVVHSDLDRHFGGLQVEWHRDGRRVRFEKELHESESMAASIRVEAWPEHRGVQVRVTVKNLGTATWGPLAHPAVCLSSQEADRFHSDQGRRTLVRAQGSGSHFTICSAVRSIGPTTTSG